MIKGFKNKETEDLFNNIKCHRKWRVIERQARRKLLMINAAQALQDLTRPPGNRLEALKGNRLGQHSIRINDQYRICFVWKDQDAHDVEITDYH